MAKSVYDELGGFATVRKVVMEFYNRVLDDDQLAPFFEGTNMEMQIEHQTQFISFLLGGPVSFNDTHLKHVHSHMKIADTHFDMIKETLGETLEDFDLSDEHIAFVAGEFEARRPLIVTV